MVAGRQLSLGDCLQHCLRGEMALPRVLYAIAATRAGVRGRGVAPALRARACVGARIRKACPQTPQCLRARGVARILGFASPQTRAQTPPRTRRVGALARARSSSTFFEKKREGCACRPEVADAE